MKNFENKPREKSVRTQKNQKATNIQNPVQQNKISNKDDTNTFEKNSSSKIKLLTTKNKPFIKIELAEECVDKNEKVEFSNMNDLLMTEALLKIHSDYLYQLQNSLEKFKRNCNELREESLSDKIYSLKKNLIVEYVTCGDVARESNLREKLVRNIFHINC